jgi:hypothetical protein
MFELTTDPSRPDPPNPLEKGTGTGIKPLKPLFKSKSPLKRGI